MELQIKNLSYHLNQKLLLSNINININQNQWIIITGPVGCGKTTLSFLISGLIKTKIDFIKIIDQKKQILEVESLREVGLIRQNFKQQILFTTTKKELQFGLENRGIKKENGDIYIEEIMDSWNIRNTNTNNLSDFEIISMLSASYILMGKKFLIFDEIFIHLTYKEKKSLLSLLYKNNVGIIFITQYPDIFNSYQCDLFYLNKVIVRVNSINRDKINLKNNYFYIKSIKILNKIWDKIKDKHDVIYIPAEAENYLFFNTVREELIWASISIDDFLKYSTYLFLPENILEKNPLSLSGGERRKLIFLLSLLKENKYILIENLLLHLDIESINKIIELIGIVSQNNIKLLYTLPNTKLLSH